MQNGEALRYYTMALQQDPNEIRVLRQMADLLKHLKRDDEAAVYTKRFEELTGTD